LAKPSSKELSKRRTPTPEFNAKVAVETITGRKTIQELAADHVIRPIQVSEWKRQLRDGAFNLFMRSNKTVSFQGAGRAPRPQLLQWVSAFSG
jgi:putative transposase